MIVTRHAIDRWIERINPRASLDDAEVAIRASQAAIEAAARFGCRIIILGNGGRLVLDGMTVVTVLAPGWKIGAHGQRVAS